MNKAVVIPENPDDTVHLHPGVVFRNRAFKKRMTEDERRQHLERERDLLQRCFAESQKQTSKMLMASPLGVYEAQGMRNRSEQNRISDILGCTTGVWPFGI